MGHGEVARDGAGLRFMLRLFRALAFVLAFMLTPGSSEVLESATHLIANGHLAHALDDEEHEPHGEEHGCTG